MVEPVEVVVEHALLPIEELTTKENEFAVVERMCSQGSANTGGRRLRAHLLSHLELGLLLEKKINRKYIMNYVPKQRRKREELASRLNCSKMASRSSSGSFFFLFPGFFLLLLLLWAVCG
jgi:hypothetical protein